MRAWNKRGRLIKREDKRSDFEKDFKKSRGS